MFGRKRMAPTKRISRSGRLSHEDLIADGFDQNSNLIRTGSDVVVLQACVRKFYATIGAANAGAATSATAPRNRGCSSAGTT